jgi:2'-5' RNA ligase
MQPDATCGASAVVLDLDEVSDHRVRQLWLALERQGVSSPTSVAPATNRPHVTLAIIDGEAPARVAERLEPVLADAPGMPITLTALGFFLTALAPAHLAVAPTTPLVALHGAVHRTLGTTGSWPYYRPGRWTPHCTLAMGVCSPSTVADALGQEALPITATVRSARVVELPPPRRAAPPALIGQECSGGVADAVLPSG